MSNQTLEGKRLDLAIMELRNDLSRRSAKKLIIEGFVTVNGVSPMANYKVKKGDEIEINYKKSQKFLNSAQGGLTIKPNKKIKFGIIYEDEDIIVVDKPEGINSHPVTKKDSDSLLNGIYHHIQVQQKYSREDRIRLVHRLDKDTSGVLLATKNIEAHDYYSELFEKRKVQKTYYAVVHSDFEMFLKERKQEVITVRSFIGPDAESLKGFKNTSASKGKLAITRVRFKSHFNKFGIKKFSLVEVMPETGRTHQIRVHLSKLKAPILGDTLYGGQKYKRLMLHAHELAITDFRSGKLVQYESPLPQKFIS